MIIHLIDSIMRFQRSTDLLCVLVFIACIFSSSASVLDTVTPAQYIKDPDIVSSDNTKFILGFFSPGNSTNRYVGIWYMSESTIIWVANRNEPLRDSSGVVKISEDGNLVVLNAQKQVVWSTNLTNIASNSSARLLDSGNLVLLDETTGKILWQSFEQPTNTLMPTMRLGKSNQTYLTSWKSPSDPSIGTFSWGLQPHGVSEAFIWKDKRPYWRSGLWNGYIFVGVADMNGTYLNGFHLDEVGGAFYLTYSFSNKSELTIFVLNSEGKVEQRHWNYWNKDWQLEWMIPGSDCDIYGMCGPFGICNPESSPICSCLGGFQPKNKEEWDRQNWTSGCVRKEALQCGRDRNSSEASKEDGFLKLQNAKVPDFVEGPYFGSSDCRTPCLKNCSCIAYAYDPGIGCMFWGGDLIDIQSFSSGGVDLYIRLPNSELDKEWNATAILTVAATLGGIITVTAYFICKRVAKGNAYIRIQSEIRLESLKQGRLQLFDFRKIATATSNFDEANKLGQGGFGPVYKGKFQDGQEIAVKRLSQASGQGTEEFLNEAEVISKLQHRNLVRLLGCCFEANEKTLVYEYMPNNSLDAYLFDTHKNKCLDWRKRFNIIEGIVPGLLYLHRDSRLRIIHRDLKGSNILLDEELNPKISNFGTARIFQGNEDEANTLRVVGTYGYISPEYVMKDLFSEKSNVFSFGVLILEIVSGRRNTSFYDDLESLTLLGYAWNLWNEGNVTSLVDPQLPDPRFESDILRCIHISLLCVQELARDRPSMATVISMLNSDIANLPSPNQPAFCKRQTIPCATISNEKSDELHSINGVTITDVQGR